MLLRSSLSATACALALAIASPSFGVTAWGTDASGELTGSRSVGGGLTLGSDDGTHSWSDFAISWEVEAGDTLAWKYTYTITGGPPPDVSHIWIEITEGVTRESILFTNGQSIGDDDGPKFYDGSSGGSDTGWPEYDNAGIPIFTFKIDQGAVVYSFEVDNDPVYGNFFAKGGQKSVYNTGFLSWDGSAFTDINVGNYIVRPNGIEPPNNEEPPDTEQPPGVIPEPVTSMLGVLALGALGVGLRRRR